MGWYVSVSEKRRREGEKGKRYNKLGEMNEMGDNRNRKTDEEIKMRNGNGEKRQGRKQRNEVSIEEGRRIVKVKRGATK